MGSSQRGGRQSKQNILPNIFNEKRYPKTEHLFRQNRSERNEKSKIFGRHIGSTTYLTLRLNQHVNERAEKAENRLKILKRLTGTKWGPSKDTLITTYTTYIIASFNAWTRTADMRKQINEKKTGNRSKQSSKNYIRRNKINSN